MYSQKRFERENPNQEFEDKILEIHKDNKVTDTVVCMENLNQGFMVNKKKVQRILIALEKSEKRIKETRMDESCAIQTQLLGSIKEKGEVEKLTRHKVKLLGVTSI